MTQRQSILDILMPAELDRLRKTLRHFLNDPDYATGDEQGLSFDQLEFGQALPLEIVIRDWKTELNGGSGGRETRSGDCYDIYLKLYENNGGPVGDINTIFPN